VENLFVFILGFVSAVRAACAALLLFMPYY